MAKILTDGKIQVEAGDTLEGIYGPNWKQLSGYTGDPKNLPIGAILPAKQSSNGSLEGTLNGTESDSTKQLPTSSADNLTIFSNLLKTVSKRAATNANANGMSATGVDTTKVSGGTLAGVIDFVKNQKTTGIKDIYKSTTELLDNQQKQAQEQIKTLTDSGAIGDLTDSALSKLASASGMDYDTLVAIKKTAKEDSIKPVSFSEVTRNGKKVRLGFDKNGNIVSETDLKSDVSASGSVLGFSGLSNADKSKVVGWAANQQGFAQSDITKMNEDQSFADYILSKYYQSSEYKTANSIIGNE